MSIPMSEVKNHKKGSVWVVIHNDVYDVSKFLDEHPGGADSLLEVAGKDGTQAFEDVGHSEDARILMKKYKIGSLPAEERIAHQDQCCKPVVTKKPSGKRKPKDTTAPCRPKKKPPLSVVIVPRERRPRGFPCEKRWWWLWALAAMGVAAGGAFAFRKWR